MIQFVVFQAGNGNVFPVFIRDSDTGYCGKDVLNTPGVYEEVTGDNYSLPIAELSGSIDGYATKGMFLLVDVPDSYSDRIEDVTDIVKQYLTIPETAVKKLLSRETDERRQVIEATLDTLAFYEKVTTDSKVFLPESAFAFVDADTAKKMRSTRRIYVLKNADNQEIVQKSCTDTFGIVLPDVSDLHQPTGFTTSALDILRVIAPYRREVGNGLYKYYGIYHTPYYRVDKVIRGVVPEYLGNINGYSKNDTLEIQNNERHMFDNLYVLVCADTARYVGDLVLGIFLGTHFGQKISRLIECTNSELLLQIATDLSKDCPEGVTCDVTYSDIQDITQGTWEQEDVIAILRQKLSFTTQYMVDLIDALPVGSRVIYTDRSYDIFTLTDADKEVFTSHLINQNVISRSMFDYIVQLCCNAYEVNWGHTGATKAITHFVDTAGINKMSEDLEKFLSVRLGKSKAYASEDFSNLYSTSTKSTEEEVSEDESGEIPLEFDFYITSTTAQKVIAGVLPSDYFNTGATGAESSEEMIVEYWRHVNGTMNLQYFLSTVFTVTADVKALIECFIKLLRWGSVKPALLVLNDYPDLTRVFDLNIGKEVANTSIVDESKLVLVNGCKHTLLGVVTSGDILSDRDAIVGFVLCKDYGFRRYVLASWVDIGEMVVQGNIDVAELKGVQQIPIQGESSQPISSFENMTYDLFVSDSSIDMGLKYSSKPAVFNALALLVDSNVLRSVEFLRARQNKMVVTVKDRQYEILSRYCDMVRQLYKEESGFFSKAAVASTDLSAVANRAYDIFVNGSKSVPDVNDVRAGQAIQGLNLDLNLSESNIKFSDVKLEGKFTLIYDFDMVSDFPAMSFTDPRVQGVSQKLRNRIVLLLLETPECYVLCQKDIITSELLIVNKSIRHKKYSDFAKVVDALKSNQDVFIRNSDGERKRVYLHRSLSNFV